jgi:hypothetical protein
MEIMVIKYSKEKLPESPAVKNSLSGKGGKTMKKMMLFIPVMLTLLLISAYSFSAEKTHGKDSGIAIPDVRTQFFCGYCHVLTYPKVIKKAFLSWQAGKHKDIGCVECHYPPERLALPVPEHKRIPKDEKELSGKTAMEFMKTELEVLSRLITVMNMDESVVRTKPRVDDRNCTSVKCHPSTGKGKEGEYWTKKFEYAKYKREDNTEGIVPYIHKPHFDSTKWVEGQELHCTSCHQRETDGKHFEVNRDKCFLCHFKNLALNETRAKCSLCHEVPTAPLQKQKKEGAGEEEKPITHKSLEEAKVACESCHLQLVKGHGFVKKTKCLICHDSGDQITKGLLNKKLMHETHVAAQTAHCFNCHEPIEHMKGDFIDVARSNCTACHPDHHKYQKLMLAGKAYKEVPETPGLMYRVKTNCLGCHKGNKVVKGEDVVHGSGKACAACHTEKHEAMAKEWKEKSDEELEGAREIEKELLDAIENAKGKVSKKKLEKAEELLKEGREYMNLVEYGGGVHNKKYSVMLLDEAMNNFEDAIDLLGGE